LLTFNDYFTIFSIASVDIRFLLTFNDYFTIFSIASVDINKIMVVFYHLFVCPWISVEKIILTLTNYFISVFSSDFSGKILKSKMAAEIT
jgi:hypothetical protein